MPSDDPCGAAAKESRRSISALESVLDRYLAELADGCAPDQECYIRENPALGDQLRGVFRTLDFIETTGRVLGATQLGPGRQLGDFRIVRELARGGMGVVYEAVQVSLNRRVALKVLPLAAVLSDTAGERFTREALTAAGLHHSHIVPVYATGNEQGIHYYAMQFIEGESLADYARRLRESKVTLDSDYYLRVAHWGQQAAEALDYAHAQGTVHRDIKPSNLLLDASDQIWITDFGLARVAAHTSLTLSGDVVGTARYMSPEQARGGRTTVDGRTDIYSLGATLYELLTLFPAFEGESRDEVLNQVALRSPPPLRARNRTVPRDLETIIAKCMQKDPGQRYARAADLAEDCRRFRNGETIRARRPSALVRAVRFVRRHRLHVASLVVALVLTVVVLVLTLQVRRVRGESRLREAFDYILIERNTAKATELLDSAARLGVDSARLHLYRGLIPLFDGQFQRAVPPLLEAARRAPEDAEVGYALAFAYNGMADNLSGQQYFNRAAQREATTALAWYLRGSAMAQRDDTDAIEAFDRATSLRPDFTPAIEARATYRANRLLTLGEREQLEPMLRDYDAWVVIRPNSPRSLASRGVGWLFAASFARTQADLQVSADDWLERAGEDFAQARALAGRSTMITLQAGICQFCRGDFEAAAAMLKEVLPADATRGARELPLVTYHLSVALHAAGELDEALRWNEPTCAEMPAFFPLPLHRALILAELGRLDEARAICRATLAAERGHHTGLLMAAAVAALVGEGKSARGALQEYQQQPAVLEAPVPEQQAAAASMDYFLGRIDAQQALASDSGQPALRCEVAFCIALNELAAGRRQAGLAALRTCRATGVFTFAQHRLATVIQARIDGDPDWPRWLSTITSDSGAGAP